MKALRELCTITRGKFATRIIRFFAMSQDTLRMDISDGSHCLTHRWFAVMVQYLRKDHDFFSSSIFTFCAFFVLTASACAKAMAKSWPRLDLITTTQWSYGTGNGARSWRRRKRTRIKFSWLVSIHPIRTSSSLSV